jgi:hypothetical protein
LPEFIPRTQSEHIKINLGNVLTIGLLSVLWVGAAGWTSNILARTELPVVSQLAVGAQYYLKAF